MVATEMVSTEMLRVETLLQNKHETFSNGQIVRIKLTDFMTYSHVEFYPMPKMNMVLGPNGTGKSTFLCALVIGLGGDPKILGRSSTAADYIKRDAKIAIIEIELFYNKGNNCVIKRQLTTQRKTSKWFIQGEECSYEKVARVIQKFKININNLCMFLPQDRVQDFAKMNRRDMLVETQKSSDNEELIKNFELLKNFREKAEENRNQLAELKRQFSFESKELEKLNDEVMVFRKRQEDIKKIENMQKKVKWVEYYEKSKEKEEFETEFKEIKRSYDALNPASKPLEEAIKAERKKRTILAKSINDLNEKKYEWAEEEENARGKYTTTLGKIALAKEEYNDKIEAERQKLEKINQIQKEIVTITASLAQHSDKQLLASMRELDVKIRDVECAREEIRQKIANLQEEYDEAKQQLNAHEFHYKRATDENQVKMRLLSQNEDLKNAYTFLQENKSMFNNKVHGPIFLEVSTAPGKAHLVEQCINRKDLIAFAAEDPEVMTQFLMKVREEMNLKINCVCVPPANENWRDNLKPITAKSHIRNVGFTESLSSFIDGPASCLQFLLNKYQLHNIPISPDDINLDQIPPEIKRCILGNSMVRLSRSRYTDGIRKDICTVGEAKFLSKGLDQRVVQELVNKLEKSKMELSKIEQRKNQYEQESKKLVVQINEIRNNKNKINHQLSHVKEQKVILHVKQGELETFQAVKLDVDAEKKDLDEKLMDIAKEVMKNLLALGVVLDRKDENIFERKKLELVDKGILKRLQELETENHAHEIRRATLKEKLKTKEIQLTKLVKESQALLNAAKESTGGLTPQDNSFEVNYHFEEFPDDLVELNREILERETELKLKKLGNKQILQDYKMKKKSIADVQKRISLLEARVNSEDEEMEAIKTNWITDVNTLLNNISQQFSDYLAFVGCSGQISLDPGTDSEDYANYGISIKVKFREENALQELDATTQSGGERSLTTSVFLLSLQQICKVPFRIVDEINQGMDEFNETSIYFLIMCAVSKDPESQFFLITPKLLPETKMCLDLTVHCIYAGDFKKLADDDLDSSNTNSENDNNVETTKLPPHLVTRNYIKRCLKE